MALSLNGSAASVRLISHACVIIEVDGVSILTDPWLTGTAFNNSWRLVTPAADLGPHLDEIDYIWISHEHPDHFHIPSLRSLPADFRRRVPVLFQQSSDHPKMVKALTGMLGFSEVVLLPHKKWTPLKNGVSVLCYQSRQLDSALAVRGEGGTVLNVNDCDLSAHDLSSLVRTVGPVDFLLNQFSIAGFDGVEANLGGAAKAVLDDVVTAHKALRPRATIPFASFSYFAASDNRFLNDHGNTPRRLADRFAEEGLELVALLPGQQAVLGEPHDNGPVLDAYDAIYAGRDELEYLQSDAVPFETLEAAFAKLLAKARGMHGSLGLKLLKPVVIGVPDLGLSVLMSLRDGRFERTEAAPSIEINSQPLQFMLSNDFGLQTLGVSGRLRVHGDHGNWFRHRVLLAMLNASVGLAPRQIFSRRQIGYFWSRRGDLLPQIRHTASRALGSGAALARRSTARS